MARLQAIEARAQNAHAELVIPFVGEFSAGKTSLINALSDSKVLESATLPTTATLYQIHFGEERNKAVALTPDGEELPLDLADLKNRELQKYPMVHLYDTSTRVPKELILLDTPGLSSPEPKHKEVLIGILPIVDAVMLVADVNQTLTKSLLDFVKDMKLAKKTVYLTLTLCDTKTPEQAKEVKTYIARHLGIPSEDIACVSAFKDNLNELYALFEKLQDKKDQILARVNALRLKDIVAELLQTSEELIKASESPKAIEEEVARNERELERIQLNIERLLDQVQEQLREHVDETQRELRNRLSLSLSSILSQSGISYNEKILAEVENSKRILLQNFTRHLSDTLRSVNRSAADTQVKLPSAESLDLSGLEEQASQLVVEDFDSIGHGYDKLIGNVALAASGVAAVALTAGAGAIAAAGAAGASTVAAGTAVAAEGVTAVATVGTAVKVGKLARAVNMMKHLPLAMQQGQSINAALSQATGREKGFIEGLVGKVSEFMVSKPRRERAVNDFLENQLLPNFKQDLQNYLRASLRLVQDHLNAEASTVIGEKQGALNDLKQQLAREQAAYRERITLLKEQKAVLSTLLK